MNKYSFMNIVIHFLATCKLFLQKKISFIQKLVLDCLFSEKFLTLTIERKQRQRNYSLPLKHIKYMNRFINFLATCKLFLQKSIERTQNEHEF